MSNILYVAIGGALGSVLRYLVSLGVPMLIGRSQILTGTLVVNILGCFLMGFLIQWMESRQLMDTGLRLMLLVGFLGGFTTFSTFGLEGFELLQESVQHLLLYTGVQFILGIGGVWGGLSIARWLMS